MIRRYLLATVLMILSFSIQAQTGDTQGFGNLKFEIPVESYDSMLVEFNTRNAREAYDRYVGEFINFDIDAVDLRSALPDQEYEKRLMMMATEIQLPYNDIVKRYIAVYTRKGLMERILGLAQYYFPMVEEALYRHGLPMELKMLPVIESALIPKAVSSAAAVGLWQFMLRTGKYYGLEVNSFVDERCDPLKSTEAACLMLKDLYKMYGDWTLVIAAYNCGSGNVNKALKRVPNAKTYWDIYDYLPRETRGYVPGFIAASYAYTFHKAHGLEPVAPSHTITTDTVTINRMMHFEQISTTIGVPVETLRELNPQYRKDIIPARGAKYILTLPQQDISAFIEKEFDIYGKDSIYLEKYLNISNLSDIPSSSNSRQTSRAASSGSSSGTKIAYKVQKGDTLGKIALKYKVTVKQIQGWNSMKNTNLSIGKTLTIYRK